MIIVYKGNCAILDNLFMELITGSMFLILIKGGIDLNKIFKFIPVLLVLLLLTGIASCKPDQTQSRPIGTPKSTATETASPSEQKSPEASPESNKDDLEILVNGNNRFAIELYRQLGGKKGNIFFSPYSISTALGMTYAGARGKTEEQMAQTLNFELDQAKLHPAFKELLDIINSYEKKGDCKLAVANRLWAQEGFKFLPEFFSLTKKYYDATLKELDFKEDQEGSRQTINHWVEEKTNDKIKNLIPKGVITSETRLVLTNAIYFKGEWAKQFKEEDTRKEKFYLIDGNTVEADMMHKSDKLNYSKEEGFGVVEIPYKNNSLSMLIFLPDEKDGIKDLDKNVTYEMLEKAIDNMNKAQVNLSLPRFKTTSFFSLKSILIKMGMPSAFSDTLADFSGMEPEKKLKIQDVIHKAFVEINEEGTEAAAATGVVVGIKAVAPPGEIIDFIVDHPFIFIIRDNKTGSILFMGRVMNPRS